jgi:hypothetical protein
MERDEAKSEAVRRWGDQGMIFDRIEDSPNRPMNKSIGRVGRYWVGRDSFDFGNGKSWDDAFDARDSKQANGGHDGRH